MTDDLPEIVMLEAALDVDADLLETAFNVLDYLSLHPPLLVDDQLLVPPIPWNDFWDTLAEYSGVLIAANSGASHVITESVLAYQRLSGLQEVVE